MWNGCRNEPPARSINNFPLQPTPYPNSTMNTRPTLHRLGSLLSSLLLLALTVRTLCAPTTLPLFKR